MRKLLGVVLAGGVAVVAPADAQRRFRIGPVYHSIALANGAGDAREYPALGGSFAYLTGDDSEMGLTVARYGDLSDDACVRRMTFYGLDSYYYPVGARGIAPFAGAQIGVARVTESEAPLLFPCGTGTPVSTTTELGLAYGLGVRIGAPTFAGLVEGRFFQVPHSFVQGLEVRANAAFAFGRTRRSDLLAGTLGPVASYLVSLGGPLEARAPFLGVRFRRDTRSSGTLGLQIDYAPLEITRGCTSLCEPSAVLFAPGYEAAVHPSWGRFYAGLGGLLAGFPGDGPDRGIARGLHGGLGADIVAGAVMWNVQSRLLWLQRNTGESVFGIQLGVGLSPKLVRSKTEGVEGQRRAESAR